MRGYLHNFNQKTDLIVEMNQNKAASLSIRITQALHAINLNSSTPLFQSTHVISKANTNAFSLVHPVWMAIMNFFCYLLLWLIKKMKSFGHDSLKTWIAY